MRSEKDIFSESSLGDLGSSDSVFESGLEASSLNLNADLARLLIAGARHTSGSSAPGSANSPLTTATAPVPASGISALTPLAPDDSFVAPPAANTPPLSLPIGSSTTVSALPSSTAALAAGIAAANPTATAKSVVIPNAAAAPALSLTSGEGLIVQMRPGQEGAFAGFASTIQAYHATAQGISVPGLYVLQGNVADLTALGTVLASQASVSYVGPNGLVQIAGATPNDPDYTNGTQSNLNGTYGINAPGAWSVETGSPSVTVAVIDTGINYDHPDLYQNIWINQAELPNQWYTKSSDGTYDNVVLKSQIKTAISGVITFGDLNNPVNAGLVTDNNGDGVIDAGDMLRPVAQGGWDSGSTQDGDTAHPDDFFGWNSWTATTTPWTMCDAVGRRKLINPDYSYLQSSLPILPELAKLVV